MTNFNFEWLESGDNYLGDVKVSKHIISMSPIFRKQVAGKDSVLFASSDGVVLGFIDSRQHINGLKKASFHKGGKSFSLPKSVGVYLDKGHYNLHYIGNEDGIAAYRLILI